MLSFTEVFAGVITVGTRFVWTEMFFVSGPLLSSLYSRWYLLATVKSFFNIFSALSPPQLL